MKHDASPQMLDQSDANLPRGLAAAQSIMGRIEIIDDVDAESRLIERLCHPTRPMVVSFVNQHGLNLAWTRPDFACALVESDVLLRDGVGIEACLMALGRRPGRNMCGTDFIPPLARAFAGRRVALFGSAAPWTGRASKAFVGLGCRMVSVRDGFQDPTAYLEAVTLAAPELVILGMGMPRQEEVARAIAGAAEQPMVIVNGGAIADFLGERFSRAPVWIQQARLEWCYRLVHEPGRLWRRYLTGGAAFGWRLAQLWFGRTRRCGPLGGNR